jgi:hypothetical protein
LPFLLVDPCEGADELLDHTQDVVAADHKESQMDYSFVCRRSMISALVRHVGAPKPSHSRRKSSRRVQFEDILFTSTCAFAGAIRERRDKANHRARNPGVRVPLDTNLARMRHEILAAVLNVFN